MISQETLLEDRRFDLAVMVAIGYRVKPQTPKLHQPMTDIVRWA